MHQLRLRNLVAPATCVAAIVGAAASADADVSSDAILPSLPSDDVISYSEAPMDDLVHTTISTIDWSSEQSSLAQTIAISQCETIEFRWEDNNQERQIVEFATQEAFFECNLAESSAVYTSPGKDGEEEDSSKVVLAGNETLAPGIRWFGDGSADNCQAKNAKVMVITGPDFRTRAQGHMCSGGQIRVITLAESVEKCQLLCEKSSWICLGYEYHSKAHICAMYDSHPSIGDPNMDTECAISTSSCEKEASITTYVPPTKSPSKEPSFLPSSIPTFSPTESPTASTSPTIGIPCLSGEYKGQTCGEAVRIGIKLGSSTPYCDYHCSTMSNCVAYTFRSSQNKCYLYRGVPTELEEGDEDDVCKIVESECGDGAVSGGSDNEESTTQSPSDAPTQQPVEIATNAPSQSPTITSSDVPTSGTSEATDTKDTSSQIATKTDEGPIEKPKKNECAGGAQIAGSGCFEIGEECTVGEESCCGKTFNSVTCTCSVIAGVEMHGFGVWSCVHMYPCSFLRHTC